MLGQVPTRWLEAVMANPAGLEWLSDLTKAMGEMRAPGFDLGALVAMQRKNIEALSQANQLALEGAQAVVRHQLEQTRRTMEQFSALMTGLLRPEGTLEEKIARQAEFSKTAIEKSMSDARELTDLVAKANAEAIDVLSRRIAETLEELRDLAKKK
jgi:phasin family protein